MNDPLWPIVAAVLLLDLLGLAFVARRVRLGRAPRTSRASDGSNSVTRLLHVRNREMRL